MRVRLAVAAAIIAIVLIGIAVLRFTAPRPEPVASAVAVASPPATVEASPPQSPAVSAMPSVSPSPASPPPASSTPATSPSASPAAAPTPTQDPNLLTVANGAIIRRWTLGSNAPGAAMLIDNGFLVDPGFNRPVEFEYELPSVAHIDSVGAIVRTKVPVTIRVAAGTTRDALRDAGTITVASDASEIEKTLNVALDARYIRFTVERQPGNQIFIERIAAYGTAGAPESGSLAGSWISPDSADAAGGAMFGSVKGSIPDRPPRDAGGLPRETLVQDGRLVEFFCTTDVTEPPWRGDVSNGDAIGPDGEQLRLAGDGRLLVGRAEGRNVILIRSDKPVAGCRDTVAGLGPAVLALVRDGSRTPPEIDPGFTPGYRFYRAFVMELNASRLNRAAFAILDDDCTASLDLSPAQQRLLLDWIAAGHKLVIRDADACSSSDYAFVPYPFKTAATGAFGARGHVLSIADPSALGDPTHFLDTRAYVAAQNQQLGDADIMQTDDLHWCGHLFAVNVVGATGWVHAYTRYGRGLIIYNGFDHDDLANRIPPAIAVTRYEYSLPVQTELPCNARVASALTLYPSVDRKMPATVPAALQAELSLVYADKSGARRAVALTISGDARYRATVSPNQLEVAAGKPIPIHVTIALPRGWSGVHAFTVTADGGDRARAQTTISIDGSVALARAFMHQRRVRIYGIHFDVDSAHIQPQSEATIAQIAQVLRANPRWRLRVEGYTDSDGGATYNQGLSDRRAHAVVNDLVARYGIARARLTAAGYGLTHPVASNSTEAGKALNRRVELVRL
jgi:outer membrane protein OmpA-like peptidoglycan-associated protein